MATAGQQGVRARDPRQPCSVGFGRLEQGGGGLMGGVLQGRDPQPQQLGEPGGQGEAEVDGSMAPPLRGAVVI